MTPRVPARSLFRAALLGACLIACERGPEPTPGARDPAASPTTRPSAVAAASGPGDALAPPSTEADTLCERLRAEQGERELGAALRERIRTFPARAERWSEGASDAGARAALRALLDHPADPSALARLHREARAFADAPTLLLDATLAALYAVDVAAGGGSNATTVALVAQARAWFPAEPALPVLEALLLPERGGRRRLLAEAHTLGDEDPALLMALARAALRDGDAQAALAAIEQARASGQDGTAALGSALRQRALQLASAGAEPLTTRDESVSAPDGSSPHVRVAPSDGLLEGEGEGSGPRVRVLASASPSTRALLSAEVQRDLRDAAALLGQPVRAELVVRVHADHDALRAATCGAAWSQALYDGVLHVVMPGDELDDALRRSVRHEALHAALDAATPLAPRWFHEGVAQRFAGETAALPAGAVALDAQVLADTERDLALGVDGQTAGHAYATARAVVDALVARDGEPVLAAIVSALRDGVRAAALAHHLGLAGAAPPPPP